MSQLPHPVTGALFDSPVPPGSGWPDDLAEAATPVAHTAQDVAAIAAGCDTLPALDAASTVCRACPRLVAWREEVAHTKRAAFTGQPYWGRPAAGFGDPAARALIVGLAPAAHGANRTGRMFTGDRSGDWLYAALYRAGLACQPTSVHAGDGLTLHGVRLVAAVRCAPPQNKPTPTERATCAPWLDRELELTGQTVRAMMALGSIGWNAALGAVVRAGWRVPRPRPRFGHGARAVLERPDGRQVVLLGCYHVSQQNTFTGTLTEPMLDDVLGRLRQLTGLPDAAAPPASGSPKNVGGGS